MRGTLCRDESRTRARNESTIRSRDPKQNPRPTEFSRAQSKTAERQNFSINPPRFSTLLRALISRVPLASLFLSPSPNSSKISRELRTNNECPVEKHHDKEPGRERERAVGQDDHDSRWNNERRKRLSVGSKSLLSLLVHRNEKRVESIKNVCGVCAKQRILERVGLGGSAPILRREKQRARARETERERERETIRPSKQMRRGENRWRIEGEIACCC